MVCGQRDAGSEDATAAAVVGEKFSACARGEGAGDCGGIAASSASCASPQEHVACKCSGSVSASSPDELQCGAEELSAGSREVSQHAARSGGEPALCAGSEPCSHAHTAWDTETKASVIASTNENMDRTSFTSGFQNRVEFSTEDSSLTTRLISWTWECLVFASFGDAAIPRRLRRGSRKSQAHPRYGFVTMLPGGTRKRRGQR